MNTRRLLLFLQIFFSAGHKTVSGEYMRPLSCVLKESEALYGNFQGECIRVFHKYAKGGDGRDLLKTTLYPGSL